MTKIKIIYLIFIWFKLTVVFTANPLEETEKEEEGTTETLEGTEE
ncbi:hypothetical protein [Aureivirga sp. CE67]|nr:hypothetical protein [Aureivirga sp. CE67]